MVMSNFIDDAERHAELYDQFTPRQRRVLGLVAEATLASRNDGNVRAFLHTNRVTDPEIHWLERTGHYLPNYV